MVCPIIGAESYVRERGKSMKVIGLAVSWKDHWRNIAISLIDLRAGVLSGNGLTTTVISMDGCLAATIKLPRPTPA
jgi:hypothetical protein